MIRTKIKIGDDGTILDTYDAFGLCYLNATKIFAAPAKTMEATTYPEQEGENVLPKAAAAAFDYQITFLVEAKRGLSQVNTLIAAFNEEICSPSATDDVRTYKQITFYNPARNTKIVGYPKPISEASDYWVDKYGQTSDAAQVEFSIRVNKPSLCNFQNCELDD